MARSMIKSKNFSNYYWIEFVVCLVYILNRAPTNVVKDKIPDEVYVGGKPSVSHFIIFGCVAYIHIPEENRKSLDDKREIHISWI